MTPTKISAGIMRPVRPSYRISFPFDRKPLSSRAFRMASSLSPENGVPSMNRPSRQPTFPPICSRTWATVIRDGIAWGLMIRSGMMPCAVKGMSSCGAIRPMTPFCPCREANLSPSSGTRRSRTFTFASFEPFSLSVSMTESTHPLSPCRTVTDVSRRFCGVRKSVSSSRKRGGLVFPISTSPPWTRTSGEMSPSSGVRFAYDRSARAPRVAALLRAVRPHERGPPEASVDRGLVHDDRVFHVVPVMRHHGDDEILARGPLVERDVLHRVRLHERLLRVVEQVAPGIWPEAVVARSEAQGLLRHPGSHRDPRGRVVLGVRDHAGSDTEDDFRVDLDVGVFLRDRRLHRERLMAMRALELRILVAAPHVHPGDVVPAQRVLAFLAPARHVVWIQGDERIFLLFGVDPLDDAVPDEVGESEAAHLQLVDVLPGKDDVAFLDDEQRAPDAPLVAVDDDLTHVLVVPHVDLVTQETGPATLADLGHEVLRVLVEPDEVSVHVDPRELGLLALHLLFPEVREEELDLLFRETLRDVNHQCEILDQPAILAFWRLVRTEAAPLGRMEVAGFEMGLGPREREHERAKPSSTCGRGAG